jgi:hypothetical protein
MFATSWFLTPDIMFIHCWLKLKAICWFEYVQRASLQYRVRLIGDLRDRLIDKKIDRKIDREID